MDKLGIVIGEYVEKGHGESKLRVICQSATPISYYAHKESPLLDAVQSYAPNKEYVVLVCESRRHILRELCLVD